MPTLSGKKEDRVQGARRGLAVATPDVSVREIFQNNCVCVCRGACKLVWLSGDLRSELSTSGPCWEV